MRKLTFHPLQALTTLCLLVLLGAGSATAETYRWVDDAGNVVYSQLPPADGRDSKVIGAPPPPAESPEEAQARLKARLDLLNSQREQRQTSQTETVQQKADEAEQARQCELARHNLEALQQGNRQRFRNADGSYTRLTPEQKAERVRDNQSYIDEYCQ